MRYGSPNTVHAQDRKHVSPVSFAAAICHCPCHWGTVPPAPSHRRSPLCPVAVNLKSIGCPPMAAVGGGGGLALAVRRQQVHAVRKRNGFNTPGALFRGPDPRTRRCPGQSSKDGRGVRTPRATACDGSFGVAGVRLLALLYVASACHAAVLAAQDLGGPTAFRSQ